MLFVAYAVATAVGAVLTVVMWHYRERVGATPLAATLLGTAIFSASRLVGTASDSYTISVFAERFLYVGVGLSVVAVLVFALVYTGRERFVRKETIALLSIEPIVVVALAFSNPGNVFFTALEPDPTLVTGVAVEWGVAFQLHTIYSYFLMTVATALILEFLITSRSLYRGQALALLGGATFPWLFNAVHVVGPVSADTTPIGYVVMGGLHSVAIVRYRLGDIVPIAHDRVLDTISEGIFVVDRQGRLVDVNPAGRAILATGDERLAGRHVDSIIGDVPDRQSVFAELTDTAEPSTTDVTVDGRHYEVRVTPIEDDRDRHVGWLVLIADVTDRHRRERELERQNDRLEQFARVVSHDLRNPLNVANGYLEMARETGDETYLAEIEHSHERMETIIEDVLALARTGQPVTDPEPVSLAALAERAWDGVETGAATLTVDGDARIVADEDRVRRLLENLFRNSIEHGVEDDLSPELEARLNDDRADSSVSGDHDPPAESLEVAAGLFTEIESDRHGIYVEDDGVGIPPSKREAVFEDGYSTGSDGAGLGLSIVRQIADAHGWTVEVTESASGGARFEFHGVEVVDPDHDPRHDRDARRAVSSAE
ncbi:PAS domain-containing sensor histidine kinase [Natrarchaeobaculum aegyptiacum]|uniref:histidine kinase n=1 Tax=Natrarchaeobaculum aegyptiacum TaxID=745377 RepID=A0A2Z2HVN4_9EURY|nr:PAS domain-containing sensor histidine kinase [Natrarchaeobaculum aegyptiacum]